MIKDQLLFLSRVQGVKGSLAVDSNGRMVESSWQGDVERAAAEQVAVLVSLTFHGINAEGGEAQEIYYTFENGRVVIKKLPKGSLILLCSHEVNMMFLKEAIKRCEAEIIEGLKEDEPVVLLRKTCIELLGDQATKPLEMLAVTGSSSKELHRTCKEIEDFTRLLIDEKKADQIARRMRDILRKQVIDNMTNQGEEL
ncbi:hypothetical protein JXM67_06490 [candidate division WOR-3 bacterium]|nr:hypothetical protein [candidate division WOR-3 bacterium]